MCSNPYIDDMLIRQRIAEARADAVQRNLGQSAKPRRVPGVWTRVRHLLRGVHWAPQCWFHATRIHTEEAK
jgi:hypothetical protein